jgi:hypothetical protein
MNVDSRKKLVLTSGQTAVGEFSYVRKKGIDWLKRG